MNAPVAAGSSRGMGALCAALLSVFALLIVVTAGVASYFRLGSETAALRQAVMASVPGHWDKKFAVNIGFFTTGMVRCGSYFFNLPPEARVALSSVSHAEAGVYQMRGGRPDADVLTLFRSADTAMNRRGWERIVGVSKRDQLVAIYTRADRVSIEHMRFCLIVLDGRDLVVASASGNLAPLVKFASANSRQPEWLHTGL